jgi:hypothetical protein
MSQDLEPAARRAGPPWSSVPVYLLLLWFVSSLARGKGLVLFAAGVVALAAALWTFRKGRRQPLYALYYLTVLAAVTVGAAEALLRLAPGVLRGRIANYVFHGYHGERDGIYVADPHLGVRLKPGVRRAMYWNGHWWRHQANALGYRGPAWADGADAVFLGDSMIYGHGVEADQTVAQRFAARSGLRAANLGTQGAGLMQEAQLLAEKAPRLRPRFVLVSCHPTDIGDALYWYDAAEVERYLATPGYVPWVKEEFRRPSHTAFDFWALHVAVPLRTARLLVAFVRQPRDAALQRPTTAETRPAQDVFVPTDGELDTPLTALVPGLTPAQLDLGWKASRQALAEIKRVADGVGGQVIVFDLGYPRAFSSAVEAMAGELGLRYSPAGRVALEHALHGEAVYLANDGHWTPAGSDLVAAELADAVSPRVLAARGRVPQ